jgi:hypothetical protein
LNVWHDSRLMNALANALLGATLLAALASAAWWLSQRPYFTLRGVAIEAAEGHPLRHVSAPLLRAAVTRHVRGNFFAVDLDAVRATFETVPWVRRASVRRVWPDGLVVAIEEHRPLAFWGDGRLVNTFGELFAANLAEAGRTATCRSSRGPKAARCRSRAATPSCARRWRRWACIPTWSRCRRAMPGRCGSTTARRCCSGATRACRSSAVSRAGSARIRR